MERLKAVQVVTSLLGCPQLCRFVAIFILGEAKCKKFLQFFLLNLDKKIFTAPSVEGGGRGHELQLKNFTFSELWTKSKIN